MSASNSTIQADLSRRHGSPTSSTTPRTAARSSRRPRLGLRRRASSSAWVCVRNRGMLGARRRAMVSTLVGPMKRFHVTTFGCQMNEHDSERMKGMLESLGYQEAAARADADLILFNTCSIRESADNRFIAHLGEAKRL